MTILDGSASEGDGLEVWSFSSTETALDEDQEISRSPTLGDEKERLAKQAGAVGNSNSESESGEGAPAVIIEDFCAPNQKYRSDAWKLFFLHMLPFTGLPHLIVLASLWWAFRQWGLNVLLLYLPIRIFLTFSPPLYSKRVRQKIQDSMYAFLARYVPKAQYVVPSKPFPEDRPFIFACHPHGRMFYSASVFAQLHRTWRKNILQKGDLFMTAAGPFFTVPLLRNFFYLAGAIPVGKTDILAKLRNKDHVTILIGGVKEVLLGTADDVDTLYLKNRKGFCKIAIKENVGVVPVYFFNENQMFHHDSKAFLKFWEIVNRYIKVGVPFMRGKFVILPMPYRKPLLIAIGEPMFAKEGESVDDFHQRYMKALRALFDKYVAYSPNPNLKLEIL